MSAAALRPLVPPALEIQEFEGTSWIGVVPFRMAGVMRRPLPDLPWISRFPELNVRLYVSADGKPGVWFLSLDAGNPLAVLGGRRWFHLPYHRARMSVSDEGPGVVYRSERADGGAVFRGTYRPTGPVARSTEGTLDHWLTERYCLYAQAGDGSLRRTEVHHPPWPLQPAAAEIAANTMAAPHGLSLEPNPPLLHFSRKLDVVVWPPERL
jgi:hypothetical protein